MLRYSSQSQILIIEDEFYKHGWEMTKIEIQNMSGLFFTPEEIAINTEVDPYDFANLIKSQTGDAFKSYMACRFSSDFELR